MMRLTEVLTMMMVTKFWEAGGWWTFWTFGLFTRATIWWNRCNHQHQHHHLLLHDHHHNHQHHLLRNHHHHHQQHRHRQQVCHLRDNHGKNSDSGDDDERKSSSIFEADPNVKPNSNQDAFLNKTYHMCSKCSVTSWYDRKTFVWRIKSGDICQIKKCKGLFY